MFWFFISWWCASFFTLAWVYFCSRRFVFTSRCTPSLAKSKQKPVMLRQRCRGALGRFELLAKHLVMFHSSHSDWFTPALLPRGKTIRYDEKCRVCSWRARSSGNYLLLVSARVSSSANTRIQLIEAWSRNMITDDADRAAAIDKGFFVY